MPELPEVETMRRGIAGAAGGVIAEVAQCACERKPILIRPKIAAFRRRVVGQKVAEVGRVGKRVVLRLQSGDAIVFEPRMTGLVLVSEPPSVEHLRFYMRLSRTKLKEFWYWDRRGLGSVRLLTPQQFVRELGPEKLGPDALVVQPHSLRERLDASRRAIKVALLDQRAVAGVGNLYASEILHLAGVHPAKRCDRLTADEWLRLHESLQEILLDAIRHEGSTLSDGTYRNVLNDPGGYQNCHRVYDRSGQVCRRCGRAEIIRIVQAQRSTFFCPQCQRKR